MIDKGIQNFKKTYSVVMKLNHFALCFFAKDLYVCMYVCMNVCVCIIVVVVVLLFYVHSKHLWSCRDGQST